MNLRVCVVADTLTYPQGGGHFWVYLNWVLGLQSIGCEVSWLEVIEPRVDLAMLKRFVSTLRCRLNRYGLANSFVLCDQEGRETGGDFEGYKCLESVAGSDLLLNFRYGLSRKVCGCFKRSALLDIDPGLLQIWISEGQIEVTPHDVYFTTGETVGHSDSLCPQTEINWHYTPPCVSIPYWPVTAPGDNAAFTTISHWCDDEWVRQGESMYRNDKRIGFQPFLDLPQYAPAPMELALCLAPDEEEDCQMLIGKGWRVVHAHEVASSPLDYQTYIQRSLGEFSAAKPSYIKLQTAWVSDRTLCYLASGKPVVVQHTGPSHILPDGRGMFRFRTHAEAVSAIHTIMANYEEHSRYARALAEDHFDATVVAVRLLERALS